MAQINTLDAIYLIIGLTVIFLSSMLITGWVRRYALKHSVMDEPNERSSHSIPTPTGGGLSISLSFLAGIILLAVLAVIPVNIAVALGGGGFLVSLIGWIDDHRNTPAICRAIFAMRLN